VSDTKKLPGTSSDGARSGKTTEWNFDWLWKLTRTTSFFLGGGGFGRPPPDICIQIGELFRNSHWKSIQTLPKRQLTFDHFSYGISWIFIRSNIASNFFNYSEPADLSSCVEDSVDFTHFLYTIMVMGPLCQVFLDCLHHPQTTADKMGFLRVCWVRDPHCRHAHATVPSSNASCMHCARWPANPLSESEGADVQWSNTHLQILELIFYPSIHTWFDENSRNRYFPAFQTARAK
jgi:hypothetical protein